MTLQELTSEELNQLQNTSKDLVLKRLIESRIADIKEDDFNIAVKDVDGMLKREFLRGMCEAYKAIVNLEFSVRDEYELRKREEALAQPKKR